MIEINLLPEELRAKKRPAVEPTNKSALLENAIYAVPLVLLIVIIIHLYLGVVFLYQGKVLSGLEQAWKKMEPQRAQILALKKELTAESSDARVVQALLMRRVRVAPKLNKLSLNLQPGIWFNSIAFDKKTYCPCIRHITKIRRNGFNQRLYGFFKGRQGFHIRFQQHRNRFSPA